MEKKEDNHEICLCFHVTRRKLANFIRREKPLRPSQLSECFGAGTGCGWCRPYLEALFYAENGASDPNNGVQQWSAEQYAQARKQYIQRGKVRQDFPSDPDVQE